MSKSELHQIKYQEHLDAIETHKRLLEQLHLDSNTRLDEVTDAFQQIALTLEEYLKLIGLP
ncbi:MAG: hypothetical protein WC733_02740 [Methylophilus sp.]|jgi:hypothetical protein